MQLKYKAGVGKLILAMTTCQPDIAFTSVKLSQSNSTPAEHHYHGLKHAFRYVYILGPMVFTSGKLVYGQTFLMVLFLQSIATAKIYC
jgi:hypothetical protein